jgi:hypothetical protein
MDTEALDGLWAIADALDDLRYDSGWFDGLAIARIHAPHSAETNTRL